MALKVFDLQCDNGHVFEGWFGSSEAFETQRENGLLTCPLCNSHHVHKRLSAPRLNMGRGTAPQAPNDSDSNRPGSEPAGRQAAEKPQPNSTPSVPVPDQLQTQLQAQFLRHMRQLVRSADDVGVRFAEQARSMHEGEIAQRPIRGIATREEQRALLRDGVPVMPVPDFLDDDRLQ